MFKFDLKLLLASMLFLSGCVSIQLPPVVKNELSQAPLACWRLNGTLTTSEDAMRLRIKWQDQGEDQQIELAGAFNLGRMYVYGDVAGARLYNGKLEKQAQRDDLKTLIAYFLGVDLPVESMRYWLKGDVDPSSDYRKLPTGSNQMHFVQDIWEVQLFASKGQMVPERIRIESPLEDSKVVFNARVTEKVGGCDLPIEPIERSA